jgi:LacI family transcriptional regulator
VASGAIAATEHLIGHGHKRIGLLVGDDRPLVGNKRRLQGWQQAMQQAGLSTDNLIFTETVSRLGGYTAAHDMLRRTPRISAVYVQSDAQAVGVLRAAADLDIPVPAQLSIISSEGTDMVRFTVPRISSIEHPIAAIAEESLRTALNSDEPGVRRVTSTEFSLVERESCRDLET